VATDLLLRGWIPGDPTFAQLGDPPAATVNVVVSLPTLLGVQAGVGQIPGWGALCAQQARALALAAGSTWTRIVTDPLDGRAIEATAATYRAPVAMARQVKTRDGTCRAPGCEIPATGTDLDHTIEWTPTSTQTEGDRTGGATTRVDRTGGATTRVDRTDGATARGVGARGATSETNLAALHRGHHNLKTAGFWDSNQRTGHGWGSGPRPTPTVLISRQHESTLLTRPLTAFPTPHWPTLRPGGWLGTDQGH
jgi:hypothetical protein